MKTTLISYSMTGNNERLAERVARELGAQRVTVRSDVAVPMLIINNILGFSPKVEPPVKAAEDYGYIIFMSPIWMGKVAAPLRSYFKALKGRLSGYAFASISGGAMGPNPKVEGELKKRLGKEPDIVIDRQKVELLPYDNPTSEQTSSYSITEEDIDKLSAGICAKLKEVIPS